MKNVCDVIENNVNFKLNFNIYSLQFFLTSYGMSEKNK